MVLSERTRTTTLQAMSWAAIGIAILGGVLLACMGGGIIVAIAACMLGHIPDGYALLICALNVQIAAFACVMLSIGLRRVAEAMDEVLETKEEAAAKQ